MAPTATTLYVHRNRWPGPAFAPGHIVHCAHRPLLGHTTWEGPNVGWGVHFAALTDSGKWPESAWMENNAAMDAREVRLLDNMEAITQAGELAKRANRGAYGVGAYTAAYPENNGRYGASLFVEAYDLPWDESDASADVFLAALAAS